MKRPFYPLFEKILFGVLSLNIILFLCVLLGIGQPDNKTTESINPSLAVESETVEKEGSFYIFLKSNLGTCSYYKGKITCESPN